MTSHFREIEHIALGIWVPFLGNFQQEAQKVPVPPIGTYVCSLCSFSRVACDDLSSGAARVGAKNAHSVPKSRVVKV